MVANTIADCLSQAVKQLDTSDSPRLDAELLLCLTLNCERSFLHAHDNDEISLEQQQVFADYIKRRAQGEPVAYIIGKKEFWSIELSVNPDVLIPRPETELLIEKSLELFDKQDNIKVLELGTGSGAIACALAHERQQWQIIACDSSEQALKVAQNNAQDLTLNNIEFILSNWFENIPAQQFDLILSNPPYVAADDPHLKELSYEPVQALISGADGLDDIKHIAQTAPSYLRQGGWLLLEHGYDQHEALVNILANNSFSKIADLKDLAGQYRVAQGACL